jgi:SSS family solute:Na+ symporter
MDTELIRPFSGWDYGVIIFFMLFLVSVGFICKHLNKNASDYFRGGGNMVWWLAGMSTLMYNFSIWVFTGAAAKSYNDGFILPLTWWVTAFPIAVATYMLAPRFRRLRVITSMEAVFRRYGFGTEQFFTWITLPLYIFIGAVSLNCMAVFIGSALGLSVSATTIGTGAVVIVLACMGGQWGVAFASAIMGLVMFAVVFTVIIYSLGLPEIGGISGFLNAIPERHIKFDLGTNTALIYIWMGWNIVTSVMFGSMDMRNGIKYVRAKNDSHARRAALLYVLPNIFFLCVVLQIPAMCAAVLFPDMAAIFPNLKSPEEGAFLAMCFKVLPDGLLGLVVLTMFTCSMDTLNDALNMNSGFFVRNVYLKYIHRNAGEVLQVLVGKATTIVLGVLMVILALSIDSMRTLNLFDFFQLFNAMVMPPMMVPMVMGIFVKRTPPWSGWTTVLVGIAAAALSKMVFSNELGQFLLGSATALTEREFIDGQFVFVGSITMGVSLAWYFGTMLFYRNSSAEHHERVEGLFKDMRTPVDHVAEGGLDQDAMQYLITGQLSLIVGGFLLLCALIPNPRSGWMAFLCIGGGMMLLGLLMRSIGKKKLRQENALTGMSAPLEKSTSDTKPIF